MSFGFFGARGFRPRRIAVFAAAIAL